MTARRGYPRVLARLADGALIRATGREGETLIQLVELGSRGVRAYDFRGGPPFRLAAYVCDLRAMGLAIRTEREPHATGEHGVYFLETTAKLVSVDWGASRTGAAA